MSTGFVSPATLRHDAESPEGVIAYAVGICNASVCAPLDLPINDVLDVMNRQWPTGLAWGWSIATDEHFASGEPHPCPCERDETRIHRLLHC